MKRVTWLLQWFSTEDGKPYPIRYVDFSPDASTRHILKTIKRGDHLDQNDDWHIDVREKGEYIGTLKRLP